MPPVDRRSTLGSGLFFSVKPYSSVVYGLVPEGVASATLELSAHVARRHHERYPHPYAATARNNSLLVITVSAPCAHRLSRSSRARSSGPERPRAASNAQGGPTGGPMGAPFTSGPTSHANVQFGCPATRWSGVCPPRLVWPTTACARDGRLAETPALPRNAGAIPAPARTTASRPMQSSAVASCARSLLARSGSVAFGRVSARTSSRG